MSRTSKALKRLGVAGVVAATIGAGVPAFFATAASAAGPTTQLVITPAAQTGAAGTCLLYTVTPQDSTGATPTDTQGQVIQLEASPTGSNTVTFCDPTPPFQNRTAGGSSASTPAGAGGVPPAAPARSTATAPGGANSTGAQTFGIRSDSPGGATIRAFVDNPAVGNTAGRFDAGEANGTATATFTAGGTNANDISSGGNAAQNAVKTLVEVAPSASANPVSAPSGQQIVTLKATNANGDPVSGVTVSAVFGSGSANGAQTSPLAGPQGFTCTSGGQTTAANGTTAPTAGAGTAATGSQSGSGGSVTNNNGIVTCSYTAARSGSDTITFFVNQTTTNPSTPGPDSGEPQVTVTRTTLVAPNTNIGQARFIDLKPEGPIDTVSGTPRSFTASVTDANAKPVQGVEVDFLLQGTAGTFSNGLTTATGTTNAQGQASVTVTSVSGQTGQATVTSTIRADQTAIGGPAAGSTTGQDTQCDQAAGAGTPSTATTAAGNCSDAEVTNFVAASPSPSASASASASPSNSPSAGGRGTLSTSTPDIQPNIQGILTASGLTSNAAYELRCYSRPSTTYFTARSATTSASATTLEFRILPGSNTRCYVRPAGNESLASNSVVINVHTTLSLSAVRTGVRTYIFQGRNLPRRAGQLITLYRVNAAGQEIRTSNLTTDASGIYRVTRTFTGNGTFQFKVRTSQTLNNAAGVSNTITVTVH